MGAEVTYPTAFELVEMEIAKQEAARAGDGPDVNHTYSAFQALGNPRYRKELIEEWREKHATPVAPAAGNSGSEDQFSST